MLSRNASALRWHTVALLGLISLATGLHALAQPAGVEKRERYRLSIGDVIEVVVAGEPDLSAPAPAGLEVGPDGRVGCPIVGMISVEGCTCEEAAKLVAKELGFDLYDREIIDAVAKEARADHDATEAHDEGAPDTMREIIVGFLEGKGGLTASAYLRHLVRVLRAIEAKGNAVVIGRGAGCVLANSFRVRVVAPFDLRVERIHVIDGVTLEQARRTVLESDRQRTGFVKGHFGCDPADPLSYDLIINTAGKSIEHTAELIVLGVRQFQQAALAAAK